MRSVKWVTRITAVERPFLGHFPMKYRYRGMAGVLDESPVGPMRVRSLITSPADGERLPVEAIALRGIAWSGSGAITKVEVEAGGAWLPAVLRGRLDGSGPATWTFAWTPPSSGPHSLAVRATDAGGHTQPESPISNEGGYGNNLVHRITIETG